MDANDCNNQHGPQHWWFDNIGWWIDSPQMFWAYQSWSWGRGDRGDSAESLLFAMTEILLPSVRVFKLFATLGSYASHTLATRWRENVFYLKLFSALDLDFWFPFLLAPINFFFFLMKKTLLGKESWEDTLLSLFLECSSYWDRLSKIKM